MTVYVAIAFSLLEITDIISGPINLPSRIITIVMFLAVLGFPFALLLPWLFITTPEGIKLRKHTGAAHWEDYLFIDIEQDGNKEEVVLHPDDTLPDTVGPPDEILKTKKEKDKGRIVRLSSFGVIVIVVLMFLFLGSTTIEFKERDWILITDFENLTGEDIFDNSLNAAFALNIDQSRHINVFPRQRMVDVLKRMKRSDINHIDEETGREIALREGIGVCIVPGISRVGNRYILTSKILEAKTGDVMRSEVIYANDQDEVIERLDQLSHRIRRNLGESRYKISGQNKPLSKVTTSSLDALMQYSLGLKNHVNLDFESAKIHYENAIQIDSNFTSAKASLGNLLYEKYDKEKGRKWLEEAIASIDKLTSKEKYGILAFYASNIDGDHEKAIEYEKTLIELYPDLWSCRNNMGWYLRKQGHYESAVEEFKVAISMDPYALMPYGNLIWIYLDFLGEMDSAVCWTQKMIYYGPENPWGFFYLGSAYVGLGESKKAEEAYLKARDLDPKLMVNLYRLAHTYRILGEPENAVEVLKEILTINPDEASVHYDLGINYELMGKENLARDQYSIFKSFAELWVKEEYPDHPGSYTSLGVVLTRLGDKEAGWEAGRMAIEMDSSFHFQYAEFLALQGKKKEAIDHLEMALESGYRNLSWIVLNCDIALLKNEQRYSELMDRYFH